MSSAAYRPSYFIWWYAYESNQSLGSALSRDPSWRHAFIRFSEVGLVLETLVPSAHHLHKGSGLHHDVGGVALLQDVSLSSDKQGDLILGEELNQLAMKRLQCATEHSVLIQNDTSSALVEFRNANERREFVNYAAQLILQSHVNFMSATKQSSSSPQKAIVAKDVPNISKLPSNLVHAEHVLPEASSKRSVKIDLDDLSRSTSNAHQALSKLTHHLQTAMHKSHLPGNSFAYSSGDDEDAEGWDQWGFLPRQQFLKKPWDELAPSATALDSSMVHADSQPASGKKFPREASPKLSVNHLVSHGTQTSAVYQTMMSKLLPKETPASLHSSRAKLRVPKSQLERNSFTEMTSDWEKTLRSHVPASNRPVSPHSPRRPASPPKSPRNVQFSATTQFVSSEVSVDTLLSEEVFPKVQSLTGNSKLASSVSPKRFNSPARSQKPEGSYAEWFEKKRAALAMVGSISFREKKKNGNDTANSKTPPFKGGSLSSRSSDSKVLRKEPPYTPRADSYVSAHLQNNNNSSQQSKSPGSSREVKPRSSSAPKERKHVVITPPRVWRMPDFDHQKDASGSTSNIVKHRSINYGNGNVSVVKPKSALKNQNPEGVGKTSPQFFQLNQDDFVELISSRESTLSPSFNHRQDRIHRPAQVSGSESDLPGKAAGPAVLNRQRRFSVFTQKKVAKLEPEISSYLASPEFQSLPVRLQKAFAIGQQNKKPKDTSTQRLFKP